MRFLSILRIPKHRRFDIKPRYYDEVKEDLQQRTSRIKRELKLDRRKKAASSVENPRIHRAFSGNSGHKSRDTGFLLFFIIVYLSGGFAGYLYFGSISIALYVILSVIPVYYFLHHRKLI